MFFSWGFADLPFFSAEGTIKGGKNQELTTVFLMHLVVDVQKRLRRTSPRVSRLLSRTSADFIGPGCSGMEATGKKNTSIHGS